MFSFLSFLAFLTLAAAITINDCPAGITRDDFLQVFQDHCYEFVLYKKREFPAAERECVANGGILVTIKTGEVFRFIVDRLRFFHWTQPVWIGLDDRLRESHYVYSDGTPLPRMPFIGFNNWALGSGPVYKKDTFDCVLMDPADDGDWLDAHCENSPLGFLKHEHEFVCQYKVAAPTTT